MTEVGTSLAGYRIDALIGRGGMGVVYRATDRSLGRPVALKLIAPELAEDERFRHRFLEESRIAASLDHANVVPVYEAGEVDGQLFLAMRYVEGADLRTLLRREGATGARARPGAARADRGGARRRTSRRARAPRRQAREHPRRRCRARLPDGLRRLQATRRRHDRHGPPGRVARLPRARADRRPARRARHGPVRARLRPVRVPGRQARVPPRVRGRDVVGAHAGAAHAAARARDRLQARLRA